MEVGTFIYLAIILSVGKANERGFVDNNLESLYFAYKLIEDTVKSDDEQAFKLKQAFFPAMNYRYWQVDGAEVIPIEVCVILYDNPSLIQCDAIGMTGWKQERNCTTCWNFQWTNSLLIPGDILLAMDTTTTTILYSDIVQSSHNCRLHLDLHLNRSLLFHQYSLDDYEQAFALFLSRVS